MILIVDLCYKKSSLSQNEFVLPIASIVKKAGKDFEIRHYREIGEKDLEKCEKVILCGTALKDNGYLKNMDKLQWMKNFEKPVLGICAGMQVVGLVFGAELEKKKEIGMAEIKIRGKNKLFSSDLNVYELHGFSLKNLENFEVLAESEKCIQTIKHKQKEIYGIMFHPEVRQMQVVENFLI